MWSGTAGSYVDLNPAGAHDSRAYGVSVIGNEIWVVGEVDSKAALWHYTPSTSIVPEPSSIIGVMGFVTPFIAFAKKRK